MTGEQRIERALRDLGGTPEGREYAESVIQHLNPERRNTMTPTTDTRACELRDRLRELLAATRRYATGLDHAGTAHARLADQLDQLQVIADSPDPVGQLDQLAGHVEQLRQLVDEVERDGGAA